MTVIASVRSMTSEPPEGSQTLRSSALSSCSSMRRSSNASPSPVHRSSRGSRSGATWSTYWLIISQASSPDTISLVKSSLKTSRTTRSSRSGSAYSRVGADLVCAAFRWIDSHCALSRSTSRVSSSSLAPSAAVRMITPALSGTIRRRMSFSRARSVSGSLRLMPVIEPFGTYTR